MQIEEMPMLRVFFSKTGRAKYTSHLDTMRTMTRAFRRSGLPLWYTQGFNPHIYMMFALPIALGYESLCESVDIRLTEVVPFASVTERLNRALPPGFSATMAATPVMEPGKIVWADYDIRLIYAQGEAAGMLEKLAAFQNQPVIEVAKKTKKGDKIVDIKPLCEPLHSRVDEDAVYLSMRTAAGIATNINPTLWLKELYRWSNSLPEGVKITRTAILTADLAPFA